MNKVAIFSLGHNAKRPKPYLVKWTVSGRHKTRAFRTKAEAQKFHRRLQRALEDGLDFSSNTGLPVSWTKSLTSFISCAEEFITLKWDSLSPRSRESLTNNTAVVAYELIRERGKNNYERQDVIRVIRQNILSLNKPTATTDLEEEISHFIYKSSVKLNEIDTTVISLALTKMNKLLHNGKPVASDTYRLRKQAFGQVLDHAYRNQYISENPMKRVKLNRDVDSTEIDPKTVLSPERCREIAIEVSNCSGNKNVLLNASVVSKVLSVIWLAGLRPSEVVALQKKHLNFSSEGKTSFIKVEQASVTITPNFTDDNESFVIKELKARGRKAYRNVPMMQELVDILRVLSQDLEDEDFLFTESSNQTRPIATGVIYDYFKRVVTSDHKPYDLRHTNASILIHSGLNIIEVASRLGHSIPVCQKVYLHLFADAADVDTSKEEEFLAKTRGKPNLKAVST
jgi:integrase